MFCFLKMLVKKIETSHFLRAIFIFGCQILLFSCLYAKTLLIGLAQVLKAKAKVQAKAYH